jgi:hypothetical protein
MLPQVKNKVFERGLKMRRTALVALLAVIGLGLSAKADTLNYEISSASSVSAYTSGNNGLAIDTAMAPNILNGTEQFTLSDGESETFDFFKIWSTESTINSDDVTPQSITADLDFAVPTGVTVTIGGQTVGSDKPIKFFGHVIGTIGTGADVSWDDLPIVVTTADRVFDVSLSDTTFNSVFGFYVPGPALAGTVEATITQVSSGSITPVGGPVAVPVPASVYGGAVLAGLMLLGRLGFRRAAKAVI